jgi:hypothetical protein
MQPLRGFLMNWPVKCPHCGKTFDSQDSYGDSRQMRDVHLLREHPDLPDPTTDQRLVEP